MKDSPLNLFCMYDVFLCFHGEDTREGFTNYLCDALVKRNIKTFMDTRLPRGRPISELLEKIERSKVCVVVFSENFASSEWCLEELATIFKQRECREIVRLEVLPVFYKVEPFQLRDQAVGRTAEYLDGHGKKYGENSDKVKRWRSAVRDLANLAGCPYDNGVVELEFIQKIVREVSKMASWKNQMRQQFKFVWNKFNEISS